MKWRWFVPLHGSALRFASSLGVEEITAALNRLDPERNITHLCHNGVRIELGAGDIFATLQGFPEDMAADTIREVVSSLVGNQACGVRSGL